MVALLYIEIPSPLKLLIIQFLQNLSKTNIRSLIFTHAAYLCMTALRPLRHRSVSLCINLLKDGSASSYKDEYFNYNITVYHYLFGGSNVLLATTATRMRRRRFFFSIIGISVSSRCIGCITCDLFHWNDGHV